MKIISKSVVVTLAVVCALALYGRSVQADVIFDDTFGSSGLNAAAGTPTSSSTTYEWLVGNTNGSATIGSGDLSLRLPSTSSVLGEAEALFPSVSLNSVSGNYIELQVIFKATQNINSAAAAAEQVDIGLFNSNGYAPNTGQVYLCGTGTLAVSNGSAKWQGFSGQMFVSNASNRILVRSAQTSGGNSDQDLLFNNASSNSSYHSPGGTPIGSVVTTGPKNVAFTAGATYTMDLKATVNTSGGLDILNTIYTGAGTTGTQLFSNNSTTPYTATSTFDSFAFGWRFNTTADVSTMDVNEIIVTATNVPEPSTLMLVGSGLALMLAAIRRRNS